MKTLFIFNDAPYGSDRTYNGARLAGSLSKVAGEEVRAFLMGDSAACAKDHQKVPEGFYNLQLMLSRVLHNGGQLGVCGTWRATGRMRDLYGCSRDRGDRVVQGGAKEHARRAYRLDAVGGQGHRLLVPAWLARRRAWRGSPP